jgi:hypothetical protein
MKHIQEINIPIRLKDVLVGTAYSGKIGELFIVTADVLKKPMLYRTYTRGIVK